jgi:hypothetical protein
MSVMKLETTRLKKFRLSFLLLGVIVSWMTTLSSFIEFYRNEGTVFKIKDCIIANPITTPCFWGSLAFLGALVLAYNHLRKEDLKFERNFFYFMIFCILFAWSSFTVELTGVKQAPGAFFTVCKPAANPFLSACFFGSILFTLSFMTSWILFRKTKGLKTQAD